MMSMRYVMATGAFGIYDKVVFVYVGLACMYGCATIGQSMYGLSEANLYLSLCEKSLNTWSVITD